MSSRARLAITVVAALTALASVGAYLASGGVSTLGDPDSVEAALQPAPAMATGSPTTGADASEPQRVPESGAATESGTDRIEPDRDRAPLLQPNDANPDPGPAPVGLTIGRIGVDAPVVPTGVDSATGQMEVPSNVDDVAWYRFGSSPGESGSAVLAAHVDLASQGPGVFFELQTLEPGDVVTVDYDDGSSRRFVVEARTVYAKDELPLDAIFARTGAPVLTLITCGGGFNETAQNYDSNVVVYAVPDLVPGV